MAPSPARPTVEVPTRVWALFAAVIHHGLACLSASAKPSGRETVIQTAKDFEGYLNETRTNATD